LLSSLSSHASTFITISHFYKSVWALHHKVKVTLHQYWKTNSMEQSPWEANSHSASQETPHQSWKLNIHYCVHKNLQTSNDQNKIQLYRLLIPNFIKIHWLVSLDETYWQTLTLYVNYNCVQNTHKGKTYFELNWECWGSSAPHVSVTTLQKVNNPTEINL